MSREFTDFMVSQQVEGFDDNNRQYYLDERIFQVIYKPEIAYWLGFLMADGNVKGNSLTLRLAQKDKSHLLKFRKFLRCDYPIRRILVKNKMRQKIYVQFEIRVHSGQIVKDLKKYGIVARKTGREAIQNIPFEYIRDFILGYFDGDGCIHVSKNGNRAFSIVSSSLNILKIIQAVLIRQCDLNETKIGKKENSYTLIYGGNLQIERIYDYLYERGIGTIDYLERKKDKFLK